MERKGFNEVYGEEFKFYPPWVLIERKSVFENELKREISESHKLYGMKLIAVGKREDNDDVLFEIEGGGIAKVHLTWSSQKEVAPDYPLTNIFADWEDVFEKVIVKDHRELNE